MNAVFRGLCSLALLCAGEVAWAQQKIDLALFHPERNFWSTTLHWWMAEVDKATQGRVKFTPHYSGSLVSVSETLKAVRDGSVPAGMTAAAFISGQMPSMAYLEAFGGLPGEPGPFTAQMNELRPVLEAEFRKQGVEYQFGQGPGRVISMCREHHLKSLADWKNRKVRAAGRWQSEQVRALGASAIATDPSEQYLALQNRTLDCALSTPFIAPAFKLNEVAPKVTLLRIPVNLSFYVIHKPVYDKISAADRAAMRRLSIEADKRSAEYLAKADDEAVAALKALKTDVYALTDPELAALSAGVRLAFAKMDAEAGEAGKLIGSIVRKFW